MPGEAIECPSLVVHTAAETDDAAKLAAHLGGETLCVPAKDRWGIVCHGEAVADAAPAIDAWLTRNVKGQ